MPGEEWSAKSMVFSRRCPVPTFGGFGTKSMVWNSYAAHKMGEVAGCVGQRDEG